MINLLPETEKKELKREEILKKIFIILIFLLIFILILILILFSLKIYISSKAENVRNLVLEREKDLIDPEFMNFQETVKKTNQRISKIQKFWQNQILITPIFEEISPLVPNSIYFTNFSFKKIFEGNKKFADIHSSGWAENREDLFYFKKKLEEKEDFKDVHFSPTSWTAPTDINFSLSFKIEFK